MAARIVNKQTRAVKMERKGDGGGIMRAWFRAKDVGAEEKVTSPSMSPSHRLSHQSTIIPKTTTLLHLTMYHDYISLAAFLHCCRKTSVHPECTKKKQKRSV
jgi:hypothetical protein